MIRAETRYISRALFVGSYPLDGQLRLRPADVETAFRPLLDTQVQATNVPDALDPSLPRFVMQSGHNQLTVSQIAAQLAISLSDPKLPLDTALAEISRFAEVFEQCLSTFKGSNVGQRAIIAFLQYPSDAPKDDLSLYLLRRCIKVAPLGDVASASVNLGFRTPQNLFLNIGLSVYQLRKQELATLPTGQPLQIDIESLPLVEQGIEEKIDVNNKPRLAAGQPLAETTFSELVGLLSEHIRGTVNTILIES